MSITTEDVAALERIANHCMGDDGDADARRMARLFREIMIYQNDARRSRQPSLFWPSARARVKDLIRRIRDARRT